MKEEIYPAEITKLEFEIRSTENAIHNAWRQGRSVPKKTTRELGRLKNRLERMRQLFWMVTLSAWIKNLGKKTK